MSHLGLPTFGGSVYFKYPIKDGRGKMQCVSQTLQPNHLDVKTMTHYDHPRHGIATVEFPDLDTDQLGDSDSETSSPAQRKLVDMEQALAHYGIFRVSKEAAETEKPVYDLGDALDAQKAREAKASKTKLIEHKVNTHVVDHKPKQRLNSDRNDTVYFRYPIQHGRKDMQYVSQIMQPYHPDVTSTTFYNRPQEGIATVDFRDLDIDKGDPSATDIDSPRIQKKLVSLENMLAHYGIFKVSKEEASHGKPVFNIDEAWDAQEARVAKEEAAQAKLAKHEVNGDAADYKTWLELQKRGKVPLN